jgi:peptide/nickel transport system substrate-binding protein
MRTHSSPFRALAGLSLLAIAALLAGCGGTSHSSTQTSQHGGASQSSHRGGTFIALSPMNPTDIDPAIDYGTSWGEIVLSHDGLVAFRKVGGLQGTQIVPDLAVSVPKPANGGKTYKFTVRTGIRYSNGTTLKASDFTNVFERMFKVHGPTAGSFYSSILGASACLTKPATCDLSKGVVADNANNTVTFHLIRPDDEFLQQLALPFAFAVPPSAPNHDVGSKELPGTGPYMWANYTPNQQIKLVRNPYFKQWSAAAQPQGYPNQIVFKLGLPLEAEITEVENGQADFILSPNGLPTDRVNEISTKYPSQTHVDPVAAIFYMAMNSRVAPFNSLLVRRAINYATDRSAVVKVFGGTKLARPTCQVLPPNFPGYVPYCPYSLGGGGTTWVAPNLPMARKLIARSGTKGQAVTIVNPNTPQGQATGLYFEGLLNKLGYKASLKLLAPPVANTFTKNSRNKVQMTFSIWFQDYPTPSDFLDILAGCNSFLPNNDSNPNIEEFCDPSIQAQMNQASQLGVQSPAAANQLWGKIDHEVTDQAAMDVLVNPNVVTFVSKRVGNFEFNPQWEYLIDQSWVQ